MPLSKKLSAFTSDEIAFLERGYKEGLRLRFKTRRAADYQRLRLYGCRDALVLAEDPRAFFGLNVIIKLKSQPDGTAILEITRVDEAQNESLLSIETLNSQQEAPRDLPQLDIDRVTSPLSEDAMRQLMIERGLIMPQPQEQTRSADELLSEWLNKDRK